MVKEAIGTGRTTEDAILDACQKIGLNRDEVEIEVLEIPRKAGFLGLKTIPAKVRVYQEVTKADCAVAYLKDVLKEMGFPDVSINVKEEEGGAVLTLEGEGLGVIIGRRGETLDSLQYLAGLVANKLEGDYFRVTLDSGNYREKREKTLEALAKKLANNAIKTGRPSVLEPMNPYERRIIHAAVQQIPGAVSTSEGDEPNRRIIISSTTPRRSERGKGGYNNSIGRDSNANRRPRRQNGDRRPPRNNRDTNYTNGYSEGPKAYFETPINEREEHQPLQGRTSQPAPSPAPSTAPAAAPKPEKPASDQPLYSKIEL